MWTSRLMVGGVMAALVSTTCAVGGSAAANDSAPGTVPAAAPASAARQGTSHDKQPAARPTERRAASSFSLAVVPDSQEESFGDDRRMQQRSEWLVSKRTELDLRYVDHVGDITGWGWLDPDQYRLAVQGMRPLEQAGIPYSLSVGNHDTRAVGWDGRGGYGGSAYADNPECQERFGAAACKSWLLVRRTEELNAAFGADRFGAVKGAYEAGKIDNTYSTFAADGHDWLVLNVELWPRVAVVDWAKRVVQEHSDHNVIVSTHSYLDNRGGIYGKNGGYGATSPRYLWANLVSRYPNVKLVLSGHVGTGAVRIDTGRSGNKIVSLLQAFHSKRGNPVRLVRITPADGTLTTWVTSPNGRGGSFGQYRRTVKGMSFVG